MLGFPLLLEITFQRVLQCPSSGHLLKYRATYGNLLLIEKEDRQVSIPQQSGNIILLSVQICTNKYFIIYCFQSVFGMTENTAVSFQSMYEETQEQVTETVGHVQDHIEVQVKKHINNNYSNNKNNNCYTDFPLS